jgi:hypothetical protein
MQLPVGNSVSDDLQQNHSAGSFVQAVVARVVLQHQLLKVLQAAIMQLPVGNSVCDDLQQNHSAGSFVQAVVARKAPQHQLLKGLQAAVGQFPIGDSVYDKCVVCAGRCSAGSSAGSPAEPT